jgi:hypothetical protein
MHAGRRTRAYPRAVWHGCGLACIGRHPERGAAPRAAERGRKGSQRRGDIAAATLGQIRLVPGQGKAVGASLRIYVPCQVKVKDQTIKSIIEDMVSHANGHTSGCLGTYGVLVLRTLSLGTS